MFDETHCQVCKTHVQFRRDEGKVVCPNCWAVYDPTFSSQKQKAGFAKVTYADFRGVKINTPV